MFLDISHVLPFGDSNEALSIMNHAHYYTGGLLL